MKHRLAAIVALAALLGGPAPIAADPAPPASSSTTMHDLFHFPPEDDEVSGAYDKASGLGTWTDCDASSSGSVVKIQFSYSGKAPLTFAADFVPDVGRRLAPKPKILHTLTPQEPIWTYTAPIGSCDDRYVLFVGYPAANRAPS
jgi:hypothetical protein